jgi:hypothetical protein
MNKNFTYIIRSNDREELLQNSNDCNIKLYGLPQQYRYFKCEVNAFYLATNDHDFTSSYAELRADNMDIMNGWDTNNKRNVSVGFSSLNPYTFAQSAPHTFTCGNFNGRTVRFQLVDDDNNLLTSNVNAGGVANYNSPWVLVLNMTGIEE